MQKERLKMKIVIKIIIITLFLLIIGCKGELYISDWELPVTITTVQDALDYVSTAYIYQPKHGCFLPEELYTQGYGDCEDWTLMLQHIFEIKLGMDTYYVAGYFNGGSTYHAWVEVNGHKYDATAGMVIPNEEESLYEGVYKYTYIEAMRSVQFYGGFLSDSQYKY